MQATASEGLAQGSYVAARAGFEPTTLQLKGIDSTNAPPYPTREGIDPLRDQGDFVGPLACTATIQKRASQFWVPLLGIVSPLTSVLYRVSSLVHFINSLTPLTGPRLGAPLNSYLEGALYKFIDR